MIDTNKVRDLCDLTDNEYKLFIRFLNDFAQIKAGFDVSRYSELQNAKLFTYQDLYNLAHSIISEYGDLFIQKGVKLLEYVESVCDKK